MKNQKGFTLMEMVVAVSLFAIVSVMISQLFIMSNRAQRKAGALQKVQSEARVMMAQVTDLMRSGIVDYEKYAASISSPTTTLFLIDDRGREIVIRKSDINFANTACPSEKSTPCLEFSEDGGLSFFSMTTDNFKLNSLQFYIDPPVTPENGGPDIQPHITFTFGLESSSPDPSKQGTIYLQSTISSRVYLR